MRKIHTGGGAAFPIALDRSACIADRTAARAARRPVLLTILAAALVTGLAVALPGGPMSSPALAEGPASHLPAGGGILDRGPSRPDSILTWGDGEYESGLTWEGPGVAPPYYGAFAECFTGPWLLVSVVLDFTLASFPQGDYTYDAYLWDDGGGVPGTVAALATGLEPGPIATFPEYSRVYGDFLEPVPVDGAWYVGYWPDWPGQSPPGWYLACDHNGTMQGCLLTNIAPGIGYPTGWQDLQIIWGPHTSIGVSALVRPLEPSPAERTSWGAIKALYR